MRIQISTLAVTIVVAASLSSTVSGVDLTAYRWKSRLLLVFSPHSSDDRFEALDRNLSKASLELADRDLLVFRIFETEASSLGKQFLAYEDAAELRRRFEIENGRFAMILVGKDGGTKMVCENRVKLQEVFDRIDSMPMRRQEMKTKGATGLEN